MNTIDDKEFWVTHDKKSIEHSVDTLIERELIHYESHYIFIRYQQLVMKLLAYMPMSIFKPLSRFILTQENIKGIGFSGSIFNKNLFPVIIKETEIVHERIEFLSKSARINVFSHMSDPIRTKLLMTLFCEHEHSKQSY